MSSLREVVLSRSLTKAIGPLVPGKAARVGLAATPSRLAARIAAAITRHGLGCCILLTVSGCMLVLLVFDWIGAQPGQRLPGLSSLPAGPVGWVSGRRRPGSAATGRRTGPRLRAR